MRWELSVLHIDHGSRPEAPRESELVRGHAARLGLPLVARRLTGLAAPPSEAAWSAARACVYSEEAGDDGLVAVGHTASDRAETLLMRLMEGSGPRGLGGMDYVGEGPVRRPLLDLTRVRVRGYLRARGAEWTEDPSNLDPAYLRNRVRMEAMPLLEGIRPGCTEAMAGSSALLTGWRDAFMELAYRRLEDLRAGGSIALEDYMAQPRALRLTMLWMACGMPRGGRSELEKTDRWLARGRRGSHDMPGGAVLSTDGSRITLDGGNGDATPGREQHGP